MTSIPNNSLAVQFGNKIRRTEINNELYFSILDVFEHYGSAGSAANPSKYWLRVKAQLAKQSEGVSDEVRTDVVFRFEGKGQRPTPVATMKAFMRIVQASEIKEWEHLRLWMADLADKQIKAVAKNQLKNHMTEFYLNQGMSLEHAKIRSANMWTFQEMASHIIRLTQFPVVGKVIDLEYMTLLGETQKNLRLMLNDPLIRDALPELQLRYLELGEMGLNAVFRAMEHSTEAEVKTLVIKVFKPLAEHLRMICDTMEIHHVTSKPLWMMASGKDSQ